MASATSEDSNQPEHLYFPSLHPTDLHVQSMFIFIYLFLYTLFNVGKTHLANIKNSK